MTSQAVPVARPAHRRVLVTGASGLLGNRLGQVLRAAGHDVLGVYHGNESLVVPGAFATLARCDLANETELARFWQAHATERPIDVIVHAAAMTDVNRCEQDRAAAYAANVIATRNLAGIARAHRARLLYVSTSSIFDGQAGNYAESDTPNPCNYYSWTKLLGEEIVRASASASSSLIVRATLIGVHPLRARAGNFLEWLLGALRADKDVSLFDDIRINPLSDVSLAALIEQLIVRDFDQSVLHAGTREPWSKAAIGQTLLARIPGYRGKATITSSDAAGGGGAARAKEMWLNVDRLTAFGAARGIDASYTVAGELERIADYVFDNYRIDTPGRK